MDGVVLFGRKRYNKTIKATQIQENKRKSFVSTAGRQMDTGLFVILRFFRKENLKEGTDMSYRFDSRVRYSEVGADGYLTLHGVVNYFQDCCTFHSESLGRGMEYGRICQRGWVLSAWQIVVMRYPKLGELLEIRTWPYSFWGFLGDRNFTMETEKGERLAWANSLWSYVDFQTGSPMKLPKDEIEAYVLEEKLDMEYAPRKIKLPEELEPKNQFQVVRSHVDTNHHVNNGQYVQMAEEFLPEGFQVGQMRVEYKQQARLGDWICPAVHREEGKCLAALKDSQGKPYCVIEFLER